MGPMATRTVTEILDDMNGQIADETVSFGIDGVHYEIDMTAENAAALREALDPFRVRARRLAGGPSSPVMREVPSGVDTRAVRAWAASNGVELSGRGRIPASVIDRFRAAGN